MKCIYISEILNTSVRFYTFLVKSNKNEFLETVMQIKMKQLEYLTEKSRLLNNH